MMDEFETRNRISHCCVLFSGLPYDLKPADLVEQLFAKQAVNVPSPLVDPEQSKWMVLFRSREDAEKILSSRHADIKIKDKIYHTTAEAATPCDIPPDWIEDGTDRLSLIKEPQQNPNQPVSFQYGNPYLQGVQLLTNQNTDQPDREEQAVSQNLVQPMVEQTAINHPYTQPSTQQLNPNELPPRYMPPYGPYGFAPPWCYYPPIRYPVQATGAVESREQPPPYNGHQGQGYPMLMLNPYAMPFGAPQHFTNTPATIEQNGDQKSLKKKLDEKLKENSEKLVEKKSTTMIKVSELPAEATEDSLILYFENRRQFGGGDVTKVELDKTESTAIVTFEEPEAVERILQKLPLLFLNTKIEVEPFNPAIETSIDSDDEHEDRDAEEGEVTPVQNKIEVQGVKPGTTDDTVLYYFENTKRSGGGDVQNFEREDDIIYIIFQEEDVVQRVLSREHKIDGAILQVQGFTLAPPPKPRPTYDDKYLLTGLNPTTTKDCLQLFLEARTDQCPVELVYGDTEGTVLVTFEETPGFDKLKTACEKRTLENYKISVSKVPITSTVMVTGIVESMSKDTIEFYFENTRRSGGGEVTHVQLNLDDGTCLVSFEDPEVAIRVSKRLHKVDGHDLVVSIYHECLGGVTIDNSSGNDGKPKFKIPNPVAIHDDVDGSKFRFLMSSKNVRGELEKILLSLYASIDWPKEKKDPLIINCNLMADVKDHRIIAKSWKKDVSEAVNRFLEVLSIEHHEVFQESWEQILKGLESLDVSHPDGVAVFVENETSEIIIVGYKHVVNNVSKQVKGIISKVAEELERQKKETKESKKLERYKIQLLQLTHFQDDMKSKFQNLKIEFCTEKLEIRFEGFVSEINSAKVQMYEMLQNAKKCKVGKFSAIRAEFLESDDVTQYLIQKFEQKNVASAWEVEQNCQVTMFSLSDSDNVTATHILKESVVESPLSFRPESLVLINSNKWTTKQEEIQDMYPGLVRLVPCVDQQQIIILSTVENVQNVREIVDDFITFNTVLEEIFKLSKGHLRYLKTHHIKELDSLSGELESLEGSVKCTDTGIRIRGTMQSLNKAKVGVQKILEKVKKSSHDFRKPGILKYLESNGGKEKIKQVEMTEKCVIVINEKEDDFQQDVGENYRSLEATSGEEEMAICVTRGGQRIFAVIGDITELQNIDVIVNAANKTLKHVGGLAKVIIDKGGSSIQDECNNYIAKHGSLYEGDIYCSHPGNLKCKVIIHAVGPVWQNGLSRENELLREVVFKVLEEMEKRSLNSVALPALCSGVFGMPIKVATKVIVESLRDHFNQIPDTAIKDIYLCDVREGNVRFFVQGMKSSFGSDKVQDKYQSSMKSRGWSAPVQMPGATGTSRATPKGPVAPPVCNIDIRLIKGQMSRQKVDVIINTTARVLKLNHGAVSASLLNAGGPQLQQECDQNYPNGIKHGKFAITSGGYLSCQKVFHGSLVTWDGGGEALQIFQKFIEACLTEVDRQGYSSVAFPALGTGNLGFPRDIVAKEMFQCVTDFSLSNPGSNVTEVRFVVYDKDNATIKAFEGEEKRWRSGGARKGRKFSTEPPSPQGKGYNQARYNPSTDESILQIGSLILRVYQGDITQAQTDAIVNSTNSELDLSRGAVAQAIAKAGGKELKRQLGLQGDMLKSGDIKVTTSGNLHCTYIIHLNAEGISKKWKPSILKILQKSENLQLSSVAFPALGTGVGFGSKIEPVAKCLCQCMIEVQSSQQLQYLREVHMVIYQPDMIKDFMTEVHTVVSKEATRQTGILQKIGGYLGISEDKAQWKQIAEKAKLLPVEVSLVRLTIYASSETAIDDAIEAFDRQCEKDFHSKVMEDEAIKEFTQAQVREVEYMEGECGVEIKLEKRIGRLRIHGPLQNVSDVADKVHKVMRDVLKIKQEKQEAEYISDLVQWSFFDITPKGKNLIKYPPHVNFLLEKAYRSQKTEASFSDFDKRKYIVDLNNYVEYPEDDPTDKVDVVRKDLVKDTYNELPSNWNAMKDDENVTVVNLSPKDTEYKMIVQNFRQTATSSFNILRIERIQNRALYQQYLAKKKLMDFQNTPGHKNERTLWHGTGADAVDSINTYGFNRSYCGRNAVVYGNGVYFAVGSEYSARDQYAVPDYNRQKRMYQCKVLTGEFVQGSQGLRVPPQKNLVNRKAKMLPPHIAGAFFSRGATHAVPGSGAGGHITYDSVVDNIHNPGIFVIFNDTQAYPEYLITFQ